MEVDLKAAAKTLKFPNRLLTAIARVRIGRSEDGDGVSRASRLLMPPTPITITTAGQPDPSAVGEERAHA